MKTFKAKTINAKNKTETKTFKNLSLKLYCWLKI